MSVSQAGLPLPPSKSEELLSGDHGDADVPCPSPPHWQWWCSGTEEWLAGSLRVVCPPTDSYSSCFCTGSVMTGVGIPGIFAENLVTGAGIQGTSGGDLETRTTGPKTGVASVTALEPASWVR